MEPRDTRAAAMAAALELAMTRPAASLDDVARHAGIGRATLFRHFANRTTLLREAGQQVITALEPRLREAAQADGTPEQRLRSLVALLVEAGLPLHAVFAAPDLVADPALRRAVKRLDRWIEPVVHACIEAGVLRSDLPPSWVDAAFDGLLYAAWTAVREGRLQTDAAVACLCDTLLFGFGAQGFGGRGGR